MNRKAQVPTILLIFMALLLSLMTLYVFAGFSNNLNLQSGELSQLTYDIEFNQNYIVEQARLAGKEALANCRSCSTEQLAREFREVIAEKEILFRYEGAGNFYGKVRNNESLLTQENDSYSLIIKNLFVQSTQGAKKIKRNFNLKITFANTNKTTVTRITPVIQ